MHENHQESPMKIHPQGFLFSRSRLSLLREGNGIPLQYSCLEKVGCNPWGRWGSDTTWAPSLSLFTFMHWRRKWQPTPVFLPGESQGRGGPGGLPSRGSHRVGHDWSDLAAAAAGGWMASPTRWTWVWVNSRSWWWTGRPGVLQRVSKS